MSCNDDCTMNDLTSSPDDPMEVENDQSASETLSNSDSAAVVSDDDEDTSDVLDLPKLYELLEQAIRAGDRIAAKHVLLLIGGTGAGKTTTTLYFAGAKFELKEDDEGNDHYEPIDLHPDLAQFKCSSAAVSCTKTIHATEVTLRSGGEAITICDTPGFGDTKGTEMEISNGLGIIHALKKAASIKPVLVFNYPSMTGERFALLKRTLGIVIKMMGHRLDFSQFEYIFNRCDGEKERKRVHKKLEGFRKRVCENPGEILGDNTENAEILNALLLDMVKKANPMAVSIDPESPEDASEMLEQLCSGARLDEPAKSFVDFISQGASDKLKLQVNRMLSRMDRAFKSGDVGSAKRELQNLVRLSEALPLPQMVDAVKQGRSKGRDLFGSLRGGVGAAIDRLLDTTEAGSKYEQLAGDLTKQLTLLSQADGIAELCSVPVEERFDRASTEAVEELVGGFQEEIGRIEDGDVIEKQGELQSVLVRLQCIAGTLNGILANKTLDDLCSAVIDKVGTLIKYALSTVEEELQEPTAAAIKESQKGLLFLMGMNSFFRSPASNKDYWTWLDHRLRVMLDGIVSQSRTCIDKMIQHTNRLEEEKDYGESLSCPALVAMSSDDELVECRAYLVAVSSSSEHLLEAMQGNKQDKEVLQDAGMVVAHFDTSLSSAVSGFANFAQNWTKELFDNEQETSSKEKAESLLKGVNLACKVCEDHRKSDEVINKTKEDLQSCKTKLALFVEKCQSGPVIPKRPDALLYGPDVLGKRWHASLVQLRAYKIKHGHSNVPTKYPKLGQWVKFQRIETKKYEAGTKTPMTEKRLEALAALDFQFSVLDRTALWDQRYEELKKYKEEYGHCNCSKCDPTAKVLGVWVATQRSFYKKKDTRLTRERIGKLNSIGFKWFLRG